MNIVYSDNYFINLNDTINTRLANKYINNPITFLITNTSSFPVTCKVVNLVTGRTHTIIKELEPNKSFESLEFTLPPEIFSLNVISCTKEVNPSGIIKIKVNYYPKTLK